MIVLMPNKIDLFFENQNEQADVLIDLYKYVFPDWDYIKSLDGYPRISDVTSHYIFEKFIAFDQINHPDVMAGGCWMNRGFSTDSSGKLDDWKVYLDDCKVEYKE